MSTAVSPGAWRDRTNLFISYRQSYTHHPATSSKRSYPNGGRFGNNAGDDIERAGLMSDLDQADGDAVIEMDRLPPRWLDIQDDITQALSEVARNMKTLDSLHAKHVLPGFDDESVKAKEEREIENLTSEITRAFSACQRSIKRIDTLVRQAQQSSTPSLTNADETMARNLKISLAARVGEVSTLFRKKQTAYLKKLRSLGGMSSPFDRAGTPVSGVVQNPYTDPAMQEELLDRSSAQSTLLQTAQVRKRLGGVHDTQIAQREREIEKIAQGVIDLSNIFQELNAMVIDQGSLLDRIDYNVERTATYVKEAEKELKVATGYQKKSTKRKVILLLILLVVGMFILLLVKPKRSSAASDVPPPPPATADEAPGTVMIEGEWNGDEFEVGSIGVPEWKRRKRRRADNTWLNLL
ncbi:t-SNARE [Neohortaea acidophila]|uniref:t-SNARE n=1 Tax=Neohortaea acidophila TaxID=245834 RepID=A0A6A6PPX1_9PEZI|nr:t-SNARE [Neohortaea acidophila]KAF2481721.1 t-SNARE [Neohortaea acidophila]